MNHQKTNKIKKITCGGKFCDSFLCFSDGENLLIENLEVSPQVKNKRISKGRILMNLVCPECGFETHVGLKAKPPSGNDEKIIAGRKFLIFRSRFS